MCKSKKKKHQYIDPFEEKIEISDEELAKIKKKRRIVTVILTILLILSIAAIILGAILNGALKIYIPGIIVLLSGCAACLFLITTLAWHLGARSWINIEDTKPYTDEDLKRMEIRKRRKKLRKQRAKEAKLAAKQQARQDKILTDLDDSFSKHNKH